MHPIFGLLILIAVGAFIFFAFRQGMGVRRDTRADHGTAYGAGSDSGSSHHSGDGGFGHG
jgi:hypothetical protein